MPLIAAARSLVDGRAFGKNENEKVLAQVPDCIRRMATSSLHIVKTCKTVTNVSFLHLTARVRFSFTPDCCPKGLKVAIIINLKRLFCFLFSLSLFGILAEGEKPLKLTVKGDVYLFALK